MWERVAQPTSSIALSNSLYDALWRKKRSAAANFGGTVQRDFLPVCFRVTKNTHDLKFARLFSHWRDVWRDSKAINQSEVLQTLGKDARHGTRLTTVPTRGVDAGPRAARVDALRMRRAPIWVDTPHASWIDARARPSPNLMARKANCSRCLPRR